MNKPRAVYATLTPESKNRLMSVLKQLQYGKEYVHHVTIVYKPSDADMLELEKFIQKGQSVTIQTGRRFWAGGVEAVEVRVLNDKGQVVPVKNKKPHITISTDGKAPVLSNDMLAGEGEFTDGFDGVQDVSGTYDAVIEYIG